MPTDSSHQLPTRPVGSLFQGIRLYATLSNRGSTPVPNFKNPYLGVSASDFLVESNLLRRVEAFYLPTQLALDYTKEFIWNPDSAAQILRPALISSWYGSETVSLLRDRHKVTKPQLSEWLMFQGGFDPINDKPAVNTIIELLRACGVIELAEDETCSLAPGLEPYLPETPPDPTRELFLKISVLDEDSKSKVSVFVDSLVRQQA